MIEALTTTTTTSITPISVVGYVTEFLLQLLKTCDSALSQQQE